MPPLTTPSLRYAAIADELVALRTAPPARNGHKAARKQRIADLERMRTACVREMRQECERLWQTADADARAAALAAVRAYRRKQVKRMTFAA